MCCYFASGFKTMRGTDACVTCDVIDKRKEEKKV